MNTSKYFSRLLVLILMIEPFLLSWNNPVLAQSANTNTKLDSTQQPPPPLPSSMVKFIPYDDPPVALSNITVEYPDSALEAGISGTVVVQAFIDRDGIVKEVFPRESIPGLDEAAMDAVKKTRFRPAKKNGMPVGVWIYIPIHFTITN